MEALLGFMFAFGFILVICLILVIVATWKLFTKAGKPGWHSIVPFLSTYDLYEMSWNKNVAFAAIILAIVTASLTSSVENGEASGVVSTIYSLASFALLVLSAIQLYKLSKSFGYGVGFFIGLLLFNPVFMLILGFGSAQYVGPNGIPAAGMYGNPQQPYGDPNMNYAQPGYDAQQGYQQPQQKDNPFENNNYGNYQ